MPSDLSPDLPEKFRVVFKDRCGFLGPEPPGGSSPSYTKTVNLSDITLSDSTIDPKPTGVTGSTRTVRDAWVSTIPGSGSPSNQSKLDDLAKSLAQDFYDWRSQSFDFAFNGIAAPPTCGMIDVTEWVLESEAIDEDEEDEDAEEEQVVRFHGPITRVQTASPGGEPEEFQHYDADLPSPTCGNYTPALVGLAPILGGTLASPGSGSVTLYQSTGGSNGELEPVPDGSVTAYNIWSRTVTASKPCMVTKFAGKYYVMMWDC